MEAEAADENNLIRILRPGAYRVPCQPRRSLSLIALTERVENLTIRGTKYEVEGVTLQKPTTLGQSNAFVADARISFDSGMLALILSRLED